ncbi:MAG: JAB domain-containing protein [Christensenellales bacterium]|jgi:DNA repair protein RadC
MSTSRERITRASKALYEIIQFLEPRREPERLTEDLLRHYGSPGAVIEAGKHRLTAAGMTERSALMLSMAPDIIRHIERQRFGAHPSVATLIEAEAYLAMRFIGINIERFYMLAIDASGRLIECVHIQSGSEESAPFYLKHVLSEAVRTAAAAVVITHNHPNATPRPSQADIECTSALMDALYAIGAPLIDHVIMVGKRAMSIRGFGFIPEKAWVLQDERHPILNGWLEGWRAEGFTDDLHVK